MSEMQKRQLAFFGKITAGMTHEMKNALAVIGESSGLMEDLLAMAADEPFPFRDRFLRALAAIQAQVRRGVDLSSRLNRFAHSLDEPLALVDLETAVDHLVPLARRFAGMRRVEIEARPGGEEILVETSPAGLNLALFKACEFCWDRMPRGGTLSLSTQKEAGAGTVVLECRDAEGPAGIIPDDPGALPEWHALLETVAALPGKICCGPSQAGMRLVLGEPAGRVSA